MSLGTPTRLTGGESSVEQTAPHMRTFLVGLVAQAFQIGAALADPVRRVREAPPGKRFEPRPLSLTRGVPRRFALRSEE